MMPSRQQQQQAPVEAFEGQMINLFYNFSTIVVMPIEQIIRPFHGTRYFSPIHMCFSAVLMIVLPLVSGIAGAVGSMIPFAHVQASLGMIDMWGLSRIFFLSCLIHGFRKWRLMLDVSKEKISTFEGPALFFFNWLPGGFWRQRILWEPVFVFALSIVLPNLFIITPGVAYYLVLVAIMLAMKNYVAWYTAWEETRRLLDMQNIAPIIAGIVENGGSEEDFAKVHIATLPPESRQQYAKAFMASVVPQGGERHGS